VKHFKIRNSDSNLVEDTTTEVAPAILNSNKMLSQRYYAKASINFPKMNGNYLEIGTFNGIGAANMALENPDRIIYVVDPFIEDGYTGYKKGSFLATQRTNAMKNLKQYSNVVLFEMTSIYFKQNMLLEIENIDMMFIDGSHNYDDIYNDLELASIILNVDGELYVDDYDIPDVKKACLKFFEMEKSFERQRNDLYIKREKTVEL
jgi:hypothetical protein